MFSGLCLHSSVRLLVPLQVKVFGQIKILTPISWSTEQENDNAKFRLKFWLKFLVKVVFDEVKVTLTLNLVDMFP